MFYPPGPIHDLESDAVIGQQLGVTWKHILMLVPFTGLSQYAYKEINKLNGEKIVYTNGSKFHANRVLNARGLTDCFHQIYGIEDANYVPKPEEDAYKRIIKLADVNPLNAVMFEDEPKNLEAPHKMGMQTVLVSNGEIVDPRHHITDDLTNFLLKLNNILNEN